MNPAKFIKLQDEVYQSRESITVLEFKDIEDLQATACSTDRGRCRICVHKGSNDPVHEMFIALCGHAYDRPHAHRRKVESFFMVVGIMDVVLFRKTGEIDRVIVLNANGPCFYYNLNTYGVFHAVVPRSDKVVFLEITQGPFNARESYFPEWAPDYGTKEADLFLQTLRQQLKEISSV